mmetsp:Transcript_109241/g.308138  ORF Transcript_109241/g.308138 Transcript_109241/m.308138 type:complete len:641 (-) Transcript_109241:77-1999(-)
MAARMASSVEGPGASGVDFGVGLGSVAGRPTLSWREGRFANWTVLLGERRFRLHKYDLARSSTFFEAAMAEEYASSQTDLTGILPRPCWPVFEDLLDALYSEGIEAVEARLLQPPDASCDGVLTQSTVVLLLAAADALGCRTLFERAGRFIWRRMPECALTFWEAIAGLPQPLSPPLEKVAAVSREALLRGFERFLSIERQSLLRLPPDFLLELLREDALAVRAEVRLLEFLLEYGRLHRLIVAGCGDKTSQTSARRHSGASTGATTASRGEFQTPPSSSSSRDGRGESDVIVRNATQAVTTSVAGHGCSIASAPPGDAACSSSASVGAVLHDTVGSGPSAAMAATARDGSDTSTISGGGIANSDAVAGTAATAAVAEPWGPEGFGLWRALCGALRWGEMELWQLEHVFRNPESGALTLRQEQGSDTGHGLDPAIPDDLVSAGVRYQVMTSAPTWAYERFMLQMVSSGITWRPRTPVRPSHAPPLESHQVEKFVHFDPAAGAWRPGDAIDSRIARVGKLRFQLKLQPGGEVGEDYPEGAWAVAAYIRVVPEASWPAAWEFRDVEYSIFVVPWQERLPSSAFRMRDRFTFNGAGHNNNRGWHDFLTSRTPLVQDALHDVLSPEGYLLVRAEVSLASALQGP